MDTAIIAALIGGGAAIIAAYISKAQKTVTKAEKSVVQAEKSIKEVSAALPSWILLFEHNEQGKPINGNVESLIEAVNKGYPIKIRIHQQDSTIQVMEAQWLIVDNKKVFASNTEQISLIKNESGDYVHPEETYHYFVVVGSNGHHHATRVYMDGKKRNPTDSKRHMAWIGLVPPQNK